MTGARVGTSAFAVLCVAGAVTAIGLTVHEATLEPAVVASVATTARTGLTTVVTVRLRDTTGEPRCVRLRVAARDSSGHDLRVVRAPAPLQLPAHGRAGATLRLTLSARDYAERLHGFYPSTSACRAR